MGEILTTLTANRLLPWPAWWNKHELKKPTTTKIIFLFNSRWGFVLETELSGKYTLPFEFSLYIFFYNSSCCEDQFTAVFLLRKWSLIQFTPSRSARLSSLSGLMLWFMPTYRFYSNKRPTSNLRPPRISAHPSWIKCTGISLSPMKTIDSRRLDVKLRLRLRGLILATATELTIGNQSAENMNTYSKTYCLWK